MWWLPLLMAGGSMAKSALVDGPAAARKRKTEAEIAKWSPWTGMQAQRVDDPDVVGSGIQGAMGGLSLDQNMQAFEGQEKMREALLKQLEGGKGQDVLNAGIGPYADGSLYARMLKGA